MSFIKAEQMPAPYEAGNLGDIYGLKEKAGLLSRALELAQGPVVLAVEGPWGCGKSYFLRAWSGDHGMDAEVVYFDAFEMDYLDDPLVSLIHAFVQKAQGAETGGLSKAGKVLKTGAMKLLPFVSRVGLAAATVGASSAVDEAAGEIIKGSKDAVGKEMERMWQVETGRHATIGRFRDLLAEVVKESPGQRLVFIVDELDRCRPDYALQMLEVIKHFFAVEGVHFVMGANLNHLARSVEARYGAGVDGRKYLQRFFHLEMPMRKGGQHSSANRDAIAYFRGLDEGDEALNLRNLLEMIPEAEHLTFRDMERLYTLSRLVDVSYDKEIMALVSGLMVLQACRPDWITEMVEGRFEAAKAARFFDLFGLLERYNSPLPTWYQRTFAAEFAKALGVLEPAASGETIQFATEPDQHAHLRPNILADLCQKHLAGFRLN